MSTVIPQKATPQRSLDPVTFEVIRRSFEYTCERMSQVLKKASFSPIIYDIVDFSNAIFDTNVELIGQTANCPVHIAAMHFSARASLERYKNEELHDGDIVVLNDPYLGGTHTPDVTFTAPIFNDGELLGYAVSRAHWTDVGGNFDTHIAGEGLRLPPMKIVDQGNVNHDLIAIIRNATRTPQYVDGDIQAQFGALWAAQDEIARVARKYGNETLRRAMAEIVDYTQNMTKAAIERIPDGVYKAEDYVDSDGVTEDPVKVKVRLAISGDRIHVDFSGSDPQVIGPINSPYANTASAAYYSLKFFLNHDAPANAGMYRQIDLTIPEGSWLNPSWPAPTLGCTTATASKITPAIWLALAQAIPDKVVAPTYSECNWFVASVAERGSNQVQVFTDLPAGGWGGTPYSDGMHVTMDPLGNCQNLPAEVAEILYNVRYNAYQMIEDSAGPGKYRGGSGVRLNVEFLGRGQIITMESSRTREGSPGILGGGHGSRQQQLKRTTDGSLVTIGGMDDQGNWLPQMLGGIAFQPGESFVFYSGGGGGWGDPRDRDASAVLSDIRNGIVSTTKAREIYGVAITADGEIDERETHRLRT